MIEDWQHGGFGLYVHWPFCESLCPYCDFNSYVSSSIDQDLWRLAFISEIGRIGAETQGRVLRSIYFGGGTPSLMPPGTVEAIIKAASVHWSFANDIEITLEANPSSVETSKFAGFRSAGVNRVSLGVQALDETDLKMLGRRHSLAEARTALDIAQASFERVSFDLIYARQHQTLYAWEAELTQALSFGTDHLSLYQLTIEKGTAFGDRFAKGSLHGLPTEDLGADMFFMTQEICAANGRPAYETSNHATAGQESQHNQIYWKYGDYAGIGPGAHGRLTLEGRRTATETHLNPAIWLNAVQHIGSGETRQTFLDTAEQDTEFLLMGLRLYEGIDIDRLNNPDYINKINVLVESEFLERDGQSVRLAPAGRPLLNSVLNQLI